LGLKQFEDFLKMMQQTVLQMNNQFQRILVPRENDRPLSKSEVDASVQQLRNDMKNLESNMNVLRDEVSRLFGGLQAESANSNNGLAGVPILREFIEFISLIQKQLAGLY